MQRAASSQEQENSIQLNRIEKALMIVNANVEQLLLCWDAATKRTLERERTLERSAGEWTPPSTAAYNDTRGSSANSVNSMTPTQVPGRGILRVGELDADSEFGIDESYDAWWWRCKRLQLADEDEEWWRWWQRQLSDWLDNRFQPARQRANDEEGSDYYWPDMQRVQNEQELWHGRHSWDGESTDGGSAYSWWQSGTDWWRS